MHCPDPRQRLQTFLALLCLIFIPVAPTAAWEASIERDIWGVPHIKGRSDADAAFGLGYAMAEDAWQVIESTIPYYRGVAGAEFGPDAAKRDFLVHWLGLWQDIELRYETDLQPATRDYLEAYAAGMTRYAREHPEAVTLDVLPLTGKDVIAGHMLRHLLFYGFEATILELLGPTRAREVATHNAVNPQGVPMGSNAIAVGPSASVTGELECWSELDARGTLFLPRGAKRHAVLINSATAVPRKIYKGFASYLAHRGCAVLTYDYRGIGDSRQPAMVGYNQPKSLVGFKASMSDWAAQDVTAAVRWMRERYNTLPLAYVGHSFGGQALGLIENNSEVSRAAFVASQAATWPPSAAVRQHSMADMTFNWPRLTWPALARRQAGP